MIRNVPLHAGSVLLVVVALASNAFAVAIGETSLHVDWTTFSVSGGVEGTDYEWGSFQYNGTHSESQINHGRPDYAEDFVTDSSNDWGTPVSVSSTLPDTTGSANASSESLLSTAYTETNGAGPVSGFANGNTHRGGMLHVWNDVTLTFSVGYTVQHELSLQSASGDEAASGYTQLRLYVEHGVGSGELFGDIAAYSSTIAPGDLLFSLTDSGMLSFTADLAAATDPSDATQNGWYWLEAHAHTSASSRSSRVPSAVPEPGTLALVGIGTLGGGLGWLRRRSAQ